MFKVAIYNYNKLTSMASSVQTWSKCNKNVKNTVKMCNYRYCDDIIKA